MSSPLLFNLLTIYIIVYVCDTSGQYLR